jgi:REP element-mobilizing transposase RayT
MARPLRFVPPEAVVEITTRTVHGRLLLRPSAEVNDLVLGVIGRAQHLFGVEIHAFVVMSNHMHILASVRDAAQLASFMSFVNGNIAREVGLSLPRFRGRLVYAASAPMRKSASVSFGVL